MQWPWPLQQKIIEHKTFYHSNSSCQNVTIRSLSVAHLVYVTPPLTPMAMRPEARKACKARQTCSCMFLKFVHANKFWSAGKRTLPPRSSLAYLCSTQIHMACCKSSYPAANGNGTASLAARFEPDEWTPEAHIQKKGKHVWHISFLAPSLPRKIKGNVVSSKGIPT